MSEYQYYEFQALDRTLTAEEQAALREISSRAKITSSSLTNVYSFGDFGGNPLKLMQTYFDVHVYYADYGVRRLMLRLPKGAVDRKAVAAFDNDQFFEAHRGDYGTVLVFNLANEDGEFWDAHDDVDRRCTELAPLRAELIAGDFRTLYLGWLAAVAYCGPENLKHDKGEEPPLPPGLKTLTEAQKTFCDFFMIDDALLEAAAEASPPRAEAAAPNWAEWLKGIPAGTKDAWLARLLSGERDAPLRAEAVELRRKQTASSAPSAKAAAPRRSCAALAQAWERWIEELERRETAKKAARKAAADKKAAAEQEKRLKALAPREEAAWDEAEKLVVLGKTVNYLEAIQLLQDLLALAARGGRSAAAKARFEALKVKYKSRAAFLKRLKEAGLA